MMNIGLVGCGEYARTAYLPLLLSHRRLRLVSICSRTTQSVHALHSRLPPLMQATVSLYSEDSLLPSYQDLLDDKSVVGVLIALPIPLQAKAVSLALKAGKHVLSEKPVAGNVAEARSLVREYQLSRQLHGDQVWQVAENWALLPAVEYAVRRVWELGTILGFRARQSLMMPADSPFLASGWRAAPDFKGGLMIDGAVHGAAVLRILLGPDHQVERVCAFSNSLQRHLPAPDTLDAIIETKGGVTGVVQVSYGTTFIGPVFEIACAGGVVIMDGFESVRVTSSEGQEIDKWTGGGLSESVARVFDAWADEITMRTDYSRMAPEDALADICVIEAMLESAGGKGVPCEPLRLVPRDN